MVLCGPRAQALALLVDYEGAASAWCSLAWASGEGRNLDARQVSITDAESKIVSMCEMDSCLTEPTASGIASEREIE